jgi:hypothetical protein
MLRLLTLSLLTFLFTLGPVAAGLAADLGVITGSEKGTYYQFGLNLQALGKANGFNVAVHPSRGSVENVYAVYQRPGVPTGIVQSDVLAFVARVQTDQTLKRIAKNGHSKWKTVNLNAQLKGWEQYDCVRKYVQQRAAPRKSSADPNPVMEAMREMLRD